MNSRRFRNLLLAATLFLSAAAALQADPSFTYHDPNAGVFGQPGDVTGREPNLPREDEIVELWFKVGPQFSYDNVCVYYTTDGSTPNGSKGTAFGSTMLLRNVGPAPEITFQYNEGSDDWWKARFPIGVIDYDATFRYMIGAWQSASPSEVFANGSPATVFNFDILLAWPGAGAGAANPGEGYPPVSFWKEEGVVGNNYINVMIDQNGTTYDVYYPSAGCVHGIGTKNEGYADGADTFPGGLPLDHRGQMHMNQGMAGIRVGSTTYWLSNASGVGYENNAQNYITDTNVIYTTAKLKTKNIVVDQYDYCPKDISYPLDDSSNPNRGLYIKRYLITNNEATTEEINFYYYADFALNGGDNFDGTFTDKPRGAMIAFDNTDRWVSSSGEYNPTTFGDYHKSVSVYLGVAMRTSDTVGASSGTPATDFWSDTSSDQGLGWIGSKLTLNPGQTKEVDVLYVGGFDGFAGATGTYDFQMDNAIDWFHNVNVWQEQVTTENYWTNWLASGVVIDTPDDDFDATYARGLLATALHLDGKNGGIIAGMHNGAYPFVWPRDAAWAAITLARTGHIDEAKEIFRFLRDIAYRDTEGWGRKGFWKQKYSTDGYTIWATPQVDETSCYPWGVKYIYDLTGDLAFLDDHYDEVYEAAIASSQDSTFDSRLDYNETFDLVDSMSLWEDAFGLFIYSNASVIRGLEDAADIADVLDQNVCPGGPGTCNYHNDRNLFNGRASDVRGGLDARLAWNGENTDISQVGITYPFEIYEPGHSRINLILDRINGVATDTFGNNHPIVNFAANGEWEGLINRYWGDTYWNNGGAPNPNGSPWFLSTMWYGCYYAMRQDINPGKGDIDNHKYRLDLLVDRVGPIGLGAEQIAPSNSLLYPGQPDFLLQAAWPNAWESMSFFADALMMFLDFTPDAAGNTLRLEPKLPTGWASMTYDNLLLGSHRIDVTASESTGVNSLALTNVTGNALNYDVYIRVPAGSTVIGVTQNDAGGCDAIAFTYDAGTGRVHVTGALATGASSLTTIDVLYGDRGDFDHANGVDPADLPVFIDVLLGANTDCVDLLIADMNADGKNDGRDIQLFVNAITGP